MSQGSNFGIPFLCIDGEKLADSSNTGVGAGQNNPASVLGDSFQIKISSAYRKHLDYYMRELEQGYGDLYSKFECNKKITKFPTVEINVHPSGISKNYQGVVITFDETLFVQLMQLYMAYQWRAVLRVGSAINALVNNKTASKQHPWRKVLSFFNFSKNCLTLLIRNSLTKVEEKAKNFVINNLTNLEISLNQSIKKFGVQEERKIEYIAQGKGKPIRKETLLYSFSNTVLSSELEIVLAEAVNLNASLQSKLATQDQDNQVYNFNRGFALYARFHEPENPNVKIHKEREDLNILLQKLYKIDPYTLFGFASLKPEFNKVEMEQQIGNSISTVLKKTLSLKSEISSNLKFIQMRSAYLPDQYLVSPKEIETLYTYGFDLESDYVDFALDAVDENNVHLRMLNEDVLQELMSSPEEEVDFFTRQVCKNFHIYLLEAKLKIKESKDRWNILFGLFNKISAVLSLASAVAFIIAPPLSGPLAMASLVFAMPGLVYALITAMGAPGLIDDAMKQNLISRSSPYDLESMLGFAELTKMKISISENMGKESLKLIVRLVGELIISHKWALAKYALTMRNHYFDIETLLEPI